MTFDRTRVFTLPVEPSETLNYSFNNEVTESGNRNESRIARRSEFRVDISFSDITFKCGEERDFINFYTESLGTINAFSYKSSIDFKATVAPQVDKFESDYFTYTQGVLAPLEPDFSGDHIQWAFYKKYAIASGDVNNPIDEIVTYKRIVLVDEDTVSINREGTPFSNFTIDLDLGTILIGSGAPFNDADVSFTWEGEFSYIVRFGDDGNNEKLNLSKLSKEGIYSLSNLRLIEVVLDYSPDFSLYEVTDYKEATLADLLLPLEPDNSRILSLPVFAKKLDSGRETRIANSNQVFIDENIQPRSLYLNEARYLSTFFLACKGRIVGFQYASDEGNRFTRFNQDSLSITKVSAINEFNECKTIFDSSNIDLVQIDFNPTILTDAGNYDVHGFFRMRDREDRELARMFYADIRYYFQEVFFSKVGFIGKSFDPITDTQDYLAQCLSARSNVESNGKNILVFVWTDRSDGYYSSDDLTNQPTTSWNANVTSLRAAMLEGDIYQIRASMPSGFESDPIYSGLEVQASAAFGGVAPYNDSNASGYIRDLVTSGALSYFDYSQFNRDTADAVNDILEPLVGGTIEVDYSGIPDQDVILRRTDNGLSSTEILVATDTLNGVRDRLRLDSGITSSISNVGNVSQGWLAAYNSFGSSAFNYSMVALGGWRVNEYFDAGDNPPTSPNAQWDADATQFRNTQKAGDIMAVGQLIPSGQVADQDQINFFSQFDDATKGLNNYDATSGASFIGDIVNDRFRSCGDVAMSRGSSLKILTCLGAKVTLTSPGEANPFRTFVGAFCLKVNTFDGVVGLTSFDSDLVIEGITYRANYSINSFAGVSEVNLSVDNGEIEQVLDGFEAWDSAKVAAGYLSSSRIELRLFNPLALPATFDEGISIISGTTGKVTLVDGSYKFEVRSISELVGRPISVKTAPRCSFEFGDSSCGLDLEALGYFYPDIEVIATEGGVSKHMTVRNGATGLNISLPSNFTNGAAIVQTGNNAGLSYTIKSVASDDQLTLEGEIAGAFQVGDKMTLRAFCNKDQFACAGYNNFINFGNVPIGGNFMPGLTRIAVGIR